MLEFLRRLNRDRFAARMQREIMRVGGPIDFTYDRAAFALRRTDVVANLANTYEAFRQARGEQRRRIIDNFAQAFAHQVGHQDPTWGEAQPLLTAVVRERALYAFSSEDIWRLPGSASTKHRPAFEPMTDWFCRGLVLDAPTSMALVNRPHLEEWGVDFSAAFAFGLERLAKSTTPKFRPEAGFHVGTWNDDYDSSRILLPEIFRSLPLVGAPVVTLPNRLTLLVAVSDDPAGIQAMLERAEQICTSQPKPQNPSPLILRDGAFVDFDVDRSSPIFAAVQRARRIAALSVYSDQKQHLDRAYQKAGMEFFVANYTLTKAPNGDYTSYSVWTKGVPSLLPKTDRVMLMDMSLPEAQRRVADVPWSRLIAALGGSIEDTGMFPSRLFVSEFPSAEICAGLNQN